MTSSATHLPIAVLHSLLFSSGAPSPLAVPASLRVFKFLTTPSPLSCPPPTRPLTSRSRSVRRFVDSYWASTSQCVYDSLPVCTAICASIARFYHVALRNVAGGHVFTALGADFSFRASSFSGADVSRRSSATGGTSTVSWSYIPRRPTAAGRLSCSTRHSCDLFMRKQPCIVVRRRRSG